MKKDITTRADIELLVNDFYTQVQTDELLGKVFNTIIQDNWAVHLEKMYRFWETILLNQSAFSGSPFAVHTKLDINESHFKRWVALFSDTLNKHFEGPTASEALSRAQSMGAVFSYKLAHLKNKS